MGSQECLAVHFYLAVILFVLEFQENVSQTIMSRFSRIFSGNLWRYRSYLTFHVCASTRYSFLPPFQDRLALLFCSSQQAQQNEAMGRSSRLYVCQVRRII